MWNTIDKIPIVAIAILNKLPFANSIISCIIFYVVKGPDGDTTIASSGVNTAGSSASIISPASLLSMSECGLIGSNSSIEGSSVSTTSGASSTASWLVSVDSGCSASASGSDSSTTCSTSFLRRE